jgi:hypothetical protein
LKVIVYFGDFHYTSHICVDKHVWFNDGMLTGQNSTYISEAGLLLRAFENDFYNFISFKGIDVKEVRPRIWSELELCQIGLGAQPQGCRS